METETSAPGETPQFLGVREQRVTGTMVFLLTGLSVKLAPILKVRKVTHESNLNPLPDNKRNPAFRSGPIKQSNAFH